MPSLWSLEASFLIIPVFCANDSYSYGCFRIPFTLAFGLFCLVSYKTLPDILIPLFPNFPVSKLYKVVE